MKKISCMLLAIGILCTVTAHAEMIDGVRYVKTEEDYSPAYVARSENGIIPISYASGGYGYAYMPEGGEFEFIKTEEPVFTDMSSPDYYAVRMSARGVLQGFEDGTFRPYETLTRAQMAAVFSRLFRVAPSDNGAGLRMCRAEAGMPAMSRRLRSLACSLPPIGLSRTRL